jgi:mannose-6-phosphate isomerase-like protein (cupin superfamily)
MSRALPIGPTVATSAVRADERNDAVERPWGSFECILQSSRYQVKRIMVDPGKTLSLQVHHHRAEHWIVVNGTAEVTVDADRMLVFENQGVQIPQGTVHRLANPGLIPLHVIEVQIGAYLGEDDIVRLEDAYGRADRPQTAGPSSSPSVGAQGSAVTCTRQRQGRGSS